MKVLRGNIRECKCGVFLKYDNNDIEKVEKASADSRETYTVKFIICPICLRKNVIKIEVH